MDTYFIFEDKRYFRTGIDYLNDRGFFKADWYYVNAYEPTLVVETQNTEYLYEVYDILDDAGIPMDTIRIEQNGREIFL